MFNLEKENLHMDCSVCWSYHFLIVNVSLLFIVHIESKVLFILQKRAPNHSHGRKRPKVSSL